MREVRTVDETVAGTSRRAGGGASREVSGEGVPMMSLRPAHVIPVRLGRFGLEQSPSILKRALVSSLLFRLFRGMLRVGLVRVSVWGRAGVGNVCVCVCVCVCSA